MSVILISNNPLVKSDLNKSLEYAIDIEYYDIDYLEVLKKVRDKIHIGHKLLTHPLSGSIKPNETPYKSIVISSTKSNLDNDSLSIIEGSISTTVKFLNDMKTPLWSDEILKDFQIIDFTLIKNAILNMKN